MAGRPRVHDVELVDDRPDDGGTPPTVPAETPRAPRRRWPLVLGAALLVVLVVVGVTGQVVLDRRDRARLAAVAAHPGGVAPLDGPPAVRWSLEDADLYAVAQLRTPDGLLLGVRRAESGAVEVAGADPATGDVVWRVEVLDAAAAPRPEEADENLVGRVPGWCTTYGPQEHLAVCLVGDTDEPGGRLVVVDTRERTVVDDLAASLPAGERPVWATVAGELVVVTTASPDGTSVRALTVDGTQRWSTTVPEPGPDRATTQALALGDLVALVTETELTLLDQDGATVRTVDLDGRYVYGGDTELYVVARSQDGGGTGTTIVRPDGAVEIPGDLVHLTMDDGSVPGLVLASDDGDELTAWVDGVERWSVETRDGWEALLLDGRIYLDAGTDLRALDARTGRELWVSDATATLPVTDGRLLLAAARVAGRGEQAQVVALDPTDGSEAWRAPAPPGTLRLYAHLGLLLATDEAVNGATLTVLG